MEHSRPGRADGSRAPSASTTTPRRPLGLPLLLAALDMAARLALPLSLLSLAGERKDAAIAASIVATGASAARSFVLGVALERALVRAWDFAIAVIGARSGLGARGGEPTAQIIQGARDTALHEAQTLPLLVSQAACLVAVACATAVFVGPAWLLLGGLVAAALGGLVLLGQRRLRRAAERAYERFNDVARDTSVLLEAAPLLRAHGRQEAFAETLRHHVRGMAREERAQSTWSAVFGLFPASVAVLSFAAWPRPWLALWTADAGLVELARLGVAGATALVTGFAVARSVEAMVRSAPFRSAFDDLLATAHAPARPGAPGRRLEGSLATAEIRLDDVACVHPGAEHATPAGVTARWRGPGGVVLRGQNGAGKTTLASMLLRLLEPTRGRIAVDGVPLGDLDDADFASRIAYLPQHAFVAPEASVAWHLRLFARRPIDDARLEAALDRLGVLGVLREHAARGGRRPLDVPAGELSGGERQRVHLARILVHDAELAILDEPEVAMDAEGRALLRGMLEELASRSLVVLIAHDERIVPPRFDALACRPGAPEPPG